MIITCWMKVNGAWLIYPLGFVCIHLFLIDNSYCRHTVKIYQWKMRPRLYKGQKDPRIQLKLYHKMKDEIENDSKEFSLICRGVCTDPFLKSLSRNGAGNQKRSPLIPSGEFNKHRIWTRQKNNKNGNSTDFQEIMMKRTQAGPSELKRSDRFTYKVRGVEVKAEISIYY